MEDILLDERINARFGTAQQLLQQQQTPQPNLLGAFTSIAAPVATMDHLSSPASSVALPSQQQAGMIRSSSPLQNVMRIEASSSTTPTNGVGVLAATTMMMPSTTSTVNRMVPNTLLPPIGTPVIGAIACPRDGKTPCIAAPQTKEIVTITCTTPPRPPSFWTPWTIALVVLIGVLIVYIIRTILKSRSNLKEKTQVSVQDNRTPQSQQQKEEDATKAK